ncbi:MAG: hypothetical protein K9N48_06575 [Verrucomicrobia bacterium]|nr:hypothetical protein [Verrucomicrobiota bacterium]MCF7708865.1 hypothetical protein [Verrucomicrobiota bacterium]
MPRKKAKQPVTIKFGPALIGLLVCVAIGGACLWYIFFRAKLDRLGERIKQKEEGLAVYTLRNKQLGNHLAYLRLPRVIELRIESFGLNLRPPNPEDVIRIPEPAPASDGIENPYLQAGLWKRSSTRVK